VRAKTDEPRGFFPLMAAQYFLHGTFEIVRAQNTEHATEIGKGQLVRFQKRSPPLAMLREQNTYVSRS
jgi:hypothetical protein